MAVIKVGNIVGHLPRKISTLCSLFLRRGGEISCAVNGSQRYSFDLPQGGLEIPCVLTFSAEDDILDKTKKLLQYVSSLTVNDEASVTPPKPQEKLLMSSPKRRKVESLQQGNADASDGQWIRVNTLVLTMYDKESILKRDWKLNDTIINCAQGVLQKQFPLINGFYSTLTLSTMKPPANQWIENFVQICHCRSNHWITLSTIGCQFGEIRVYDSLYDDVDENTVSTFKRLFNQDKLSVILASVQRQNGINDCGLFSIANATSLCITSDASFSHPFNQAKLCEHLVYCLESTLFSVFPSFSQFMTP